MRRKVRGLRTIEQAVRAQPQAETKDDLTPEAPEATVPATAAASDLPPAVVDPAGGVVLDYCAAVRGISNPIESTASGGETPTGSAVPGVDRDGPHRGRHRRT